tara:strand:- start:373 stop:1266 length:894 start_codon:yes stop_codon:yes gene_type:complete
MKKERVAEAHIPSNAGQVQGTNDESTTSKRSAIRKDYFSDPFLRYFVSRPTTRSALINRGYYLRVAVVRHLLSRFLSLSSPFHSDSTGPSLLSSPPTTQVIDLPTPSQTASSLAISSPSSSSKYFPPLDEHKCGSRQVVSLGAGFDTGPFLVPSTISEIGDACTCSISYFEIDFRGVAQRKAHSIACTPALVGCFEKWSSVKSEEGNNNGDEEGPCFFEAEGWENKQSSSSFRYRYVLLGIDLTDLFLLEESLLSKGFDKSLPTLFQAECVLNYIAPKPASALIAWTAALPQCAFVR